MTLAEVDKNQLSPMMRQYAQVKEDNPGCLIFYRLGDFYEMFFEDAISVSRELELTLTGRDCGLEERAPMCGVPYHSVELYLKRLVEKGYKIAIVEQMEDPALAKGLVERQITRIVTPGTLIESDLLDEGKNNYICSLFYDKEKGCALVFADISTGEMQLVYPEETQDKKKKTGDAKFEIVNQLSRFQPAEIVFNSGALDLKVVFDFIKVRLQCAVTLKEEEYFSEEGSGALLLEQFGTENRELLGLRNNGGDIAALAGMLRYLRETACSSVKRFVSLDVSNGEEFMGLDLSARRNLELTETLRNKERRGSLLWLLDSCKTAMGKRMLRSWIEQPLVQPVKIMRRLDAVECLTMHSVEQIEIREILDQIFDLERLMTRVIYKKATPRDLKALSHTAQLLPGLKSILAKLEDNFLLRTLNDKISDLARVANLVEEAIVDEPPLTLKDGGVIRDGFHEALDHYREVQSNGKQMLENILQEEKEKTGIKGLKMGYNRVFGYYLEVTRSYFSLIPEEWIRKQTLTNCERFITPELKTLENEILGAKTQILNLEEDLFVQVRDCLAEMLKSVQETASAVAQVDVLCDFATVALENNYCKPGISIDGVIQITNGRHPVIERMLTEDIFVPNDTYLDTGSQRMVILTGPNMSGKSTYMRQVALITLMAQMGCFVPADYAKISVVDKIFTRIGASDDLTAGQSTFMVEMAEVSDILQGATKNSLVILDEVGRGTSTLDGVSIAQAVAEYVASKKIGCKTLFATHYHELLDMEGNCEGVRNFSVAVKRNGDTIRFLRKIVPGGMDDSYGIAVAKLAGLPDKVVKRAKELLAEMEVQAAQNEKQSEANGQISFGSLARERVLSTLEKTNPAELTDAECREVLEELMTTLREG